MKTGKTLQRFPESNRDFPEGKQNLRAEGEECTILNHEKTLGKMKGHSLYPNPP